MLKLKLNFKQPDVGPTLSDSEVMHGLRKTRDRRSGSISSTDHFRARSAADGYLDSETMAFAHPGRGKMDYDDTGRTYDRRPSAGSNIPFSRSDGRSSIQRSWSQDPEDDKVRGPGYRRYDSVQSSDFRCDETNVVCGRSTGRSSSDYVAPGYGCYGSGTTERLPRSHNAPQSTPYWTGARHGRSGCDRTQHCRTGEEGRYCLVLFHFQHPPRR